MGCLRDHRASEAGQPANPVDDQLLSFGLAPYRAAGRRLAGTRRENVLSYFGPLSLLTLIALWAASLVVAFALFQWGMRSRLAGATAGSVVDHLYLSGTTFFTLGFGDLTPSGGLGRLVSVIEAGTGFGFLALVIG